MQSPGNDIQGPTIKAKIAVARRKRDRRIGTGCDPLIAGWQCFLEEMLIRLETFLIPGCLVTFKTLTATERGQFESLHDGLILPPHVCAIFFPPSALRGVLPADFRRMTDYGPVHIPRSRPESGLVLACQYREYRLIINALLTPPPRNPGIDVYAEGQLAAGYAYATEGECRDNIQPVIWTHLHTHVDLPSLV